MHAHWLSALLGFIEGLTEFLPISSTAHLRISEKLLGLSLHDPYWKMFSIVIQLGAILAVVVYFWRELNSMWTTFLKAPNKTKHPVALVMLAFVVTAVPAFLLAKVIGHNLESLPVMGWSLIIGGVLMAAIDWYFCEGPMRELGHMSRKAAIGVGLFQILSAVFPGTSRSMSTICGGEIMGLSRPLSLEFSFLVSIPTMVAATGYELLHSLLRGPGDGLVMNAARWQNLAIGFLVSFLVALVVIRWFMHWVRRRGMMIFSIYRVLIGAYVLWWL